MKRDVLTYLVRYSILQLGDILIMKLLHSANVKRLGRGPLSYDITNNVLYSGIHAYNLSLSLAIAMPASLIYLGTFSLYYLIIDYSHATSGLMLFMIIVCISAVFGFLG